MLKRNLEFWYLRNIIRKNTGMGWSLEHNSRNLTERTLVYLSLLMGSPLGPLMASIFAGFQDKQMFDKVPKQYCYI